MCDSSTLFNGAILRVIYSSSCLSLTKRIELKIEGEQNTTIILEGVLHQMIVN